MALPFSRNTTYAPNSQVKSADLNALQDCFVAQRNRKINFSAAGFALNVNGTQTAAGNVGAWLVDYDGTASKVISSGADAATLDLSPWMIPGDVIKEIIFYWRNGATPTAGQITCSLVRAPVTNTLVSIASPSPVDTNTGGALTKRSITFASIGHTVLADNFYAFTVELDATAGNDSAGIRGISLVLGV